MLTVTLQGQEAEDYILYRSKSSIPLVVSTLPTPEPQVKAAPTTPTVTSRTFDNAWRAHVNSGNFKAREYARWTDYELEVLKNAMDQTDPTYYSVKVIAKALGRSRPAIVAAVNRLNYTINNYMITKDTYER